MRSETRGVLRSDGTPFNRETENLRWQIIEEFETELLRSKTPQETLREFEFLYWQGVGLPGGQTDEERLEYLSMLQTRLASLNRR